MRTLVMMLSRSVPAASQSVCARLASGRAGGRKLPPPMQLRDEDLDEKFVKGSGPGGQKINKVRNCVQLTHKPTGISVSCQEARELHANRSIARTRLREKVEYHLNGDQSKTGRRIANIRNRKARSQRRSRLKHQGAASSSSDGDTKQARSPLGSERVEPQGCGSGDDSAYDSDVDSDSCDDDDYGDHRD